MKAKFFVKGMSFLVISIALLTFSNCDKILEAFDIESPFSVVFPIDVGPDDELVFMETKTINLNDNPDFESNKDKIDEFNIKRVYYKVVDFEGNSEITGSGVITFMDGGVQVGDAVAETDINFANLFESEEEVTLDFNDNTENALANLIKEKMKFEVAIEGIVSDKPAYIDIELFVKISANVKP